MCTALGIARGYPDAWNAPSTTTDLGWTGRRLFLDVDRMPHRSQEIMQLIFQAFSGL